MQTMRIETNETRFAFRVNGVTVAKRHLEKTIAKGCNGDAQKMLAKYLVIVPFLAQAFQVSENASDSIKYGAAKAKRVYEALGLTKESTVPFMLVCLQMAGLDTDGDMPEGIKQIGQQLREAGFYEGGKRVGPFAQGDREATIIPFPKKPTIH